MDLRVADTHQCPCLLALTFRRKAVDMKTAAPIAQPFISIFSR